MTLLTSCKKEPLLLDNENLYNVEWKVDSTIQEYRSGLRVNPYKNNPGWQETVLFTENFIKITATADNWEGDELIYEIFYVKENTFYLDKDLDGNFYTFTIVNLNDHFLEFVDNMWDGDTDPLYSYRYHIYCSK